MSFKFSEHRNGIGTGEAEREDQRDHGFFAVRDEAENDQTAHRAESPHRGEARKNRKEHRFPKVFPQGQIESQRDQNQQAGGV